MDQLNTAREYDLAEWFLGVLPPGSVGPEDALALGLAAWIRCGGPGRWPDALGAEDPPGDLRAALAAALPDRPRAAPLPMPTRLLERPARRRTLGVLRPSEPGLPA